MLTPADRPFRKVQADSYRVRRSGWTKFYKGWKVVCSIRTDQIVSIDKVEKTQ